MGKGKYNFDKEISRLNTSSIKWDGMKVRFGHDDLLPFWIADSDFETAPEIIKALNKRVNHGAFGYTMVDDNYKEVVCSWVLKHYNYHIEKDWIITTPGVVTALHYAVKSLLCNCCKVIVQPPVYNPFYNVIKENGCEIVTNDLLQVDDTYVIDFDDLEEKMKDQARMLILCNPHNPVGRVWTTEELEKIVLLCKKYDCFLVSDEIHCDLVLYGNEFTSIGKFFDVYDKIVICTAPSKTFNVAGLMASNIFIKNPEYRKKYQDSLNNNSIESPNLLGLEACIAAYKYGDEWLKEQLLYLENNANYVYDYFKENIPLAKITKLEGTYLMWIDLGFMNMTSEELRLKLMDYKILVNSGTVYSPKCEGYIRFNIACPLSQVKKGLERIKKFVEENFELTK